MSLCQNLQYNKIGQAKIKIFSHFSTFFFLQNGIKVYIFLILRSSWFQISNLFLATTTLGVSRQKVASGVNFEPPFWIEVITGSGPFSIPLPTLLWTTCWKKNLSFSIKIEGVTVPDHFFTKWRLWRHPDEFFKKWKKRHWQIAARPQISSCVEIRPAV